MADTISNMSRCFANPAPTPKPAKGGRDAKRRGLLGGMAALALASPAAAAPASPPAPKYFPIDWSGPALPIYDGASLPSELERACSRYLELERLLNDPSSPQDCDKHPAWAEFLEVTDFVEDAIPQTPAERAAMARVALQSEVGKIEADWESTAPLRMARAILMQLAGGAA